MAPGLGRRLRRAGCRLRSPSPSASTPVSVEYVTASASSAPSRIGICRRASVITSATAPVISETARVLKPGGLYLFDTINRTPVSKLLAIKVMQEWRLTRLTDVAIHDWDMFITPGELAAVLERHGLVEGEGRQDERKGGREQRRAVEAPVHGPLERSAPWPPAPPDRRQGRRHRGLV